MHFYKMKGKIKWYKKEKGYGFISGEDGKEYFVHWKQINSDKENIYEDDNLSVTFELEETQRGPQAIDVKYVESEEVEAEAEEA